MLRNNSDKSVFSQKEKEDQEDQHKRERFDRQNPKTFWHTNEV